MLDQIPISRQVLYVALLALIPVMIVTAFISASLTEVNRIQEQVDLVRTEALQQELRQAGNSAVIAHYKDADHFYIDKHLESLTFLEPEVEALNRVTKEKGYIGNEVVEKRLAQLTDGSNQLAFTEGVVQSNKVFQETTETLTHTVEVNADDIAKILTRVEGVSLGGHPPINERPQLLVLDFNIEKKNGEDENQVYQLNLKLLKREYL